MNTILRVLISATGLRLLLLWGMVAASSPAAATYGQSLDASEQARLQQQRQQYRDTLNLLSKGQRQRFARQAETLRDYPLYPYLKYKEYARYIDTLEKEDLEEFIRQFPDAPMGSWLRRRWISQLTREKDWDTYLQEYRLGQYSSEYDCYYYWALYKTGEREAAFAGARRMWLVGASQDAACDPLFEVWKTTGEMHGSLAWERTAMAMDNRKLQLARYLERYLPKEWQPMAREWRDLYRDPRRLRALARYRRWGEQARPMLVTAFSRLIRREPELAQTLWPQYQQAFDFSAAERARVANEFAFVLGIRRQDNARYWLSQAAQYGRFDKDIIPLGLRHALYEQDWPRLRIWLALLENEEAGENTWRYWLARAEEKLGPLDLQQLPRIRIDAHHVDMLSFQQRFSRALYHEEQFLDLLPPSVVTAKFANHQPRQRLRELSRERNYYGFLASERLQQPLNLNMERTRISDQELLQVSQWPAVRRARELFLMDEERLARLEWEHLIRRTDERERSVLAHLATLWGWYHPAIRAAYRSEAYNDLEIRFPTAYGPVVTKYAQDNGVPQDWVFSLIRQESAFLARARSPVGAMGMMQIMPRTARQLSRELGIPTPSTSAMLTPEVNVRLGTHYMSQLLHRFDGNQILATAAYNAGPHRADAWQPEYLPVPGDIWVEAIPFNETRDYVKNILTYQAIYRHHLGQEPRLSSALRLIPAKRMQATVMLE